MGCGCHFNRDEGAYTGGNKFEGPFGVAYAINLTPDMETGIGAWTAEIFLLTALRRADAWPTSDLGVIVGVQRIKQLPHRPSRDEIDAIAAAWRPWRGAVTYLLWYDYLKGKLPEGMTDE
jgi:hypothetical protein